MGNVTFECSLKHLTNVDARPTKAFKEKKSFENILYQYNV